MREHEHGILISRTNTTSLVDSLLQANSQIRVERKRTSQIQEALKLEQQHLQEVRTALSLEKQGTTDTRATLNRELNRERKRTREALAELRAERAKSGSVTHAMQTERARLRAIRSTMRKRFALLKQSIRTFEQEDSQANEGGSSNMSAEFGRFAIVQMDTRFCANTSRTNEVRIIPGETQGYRSISSVCGVRLDINATTDAYWWVTAALNAAWAKSHGYDYIASCAGYLNGGCTHPDSQEKRAPQWCKLLVIADALENGQYDAVLFLDSDAFWKEPKAGILDGLIKPYASEWLRPTPGNSMNDVSVFFGCNSPWDVTNRYKWNFSAPHAAAGSANSGVYLLRNKRRSRELLNYWWHGRAGRVFPHHIRKPRTCCSEQDALWRMWNTRDDLANSMGVFGSEDRRGRRTCMHVVGTARQQGGPVLHFSSNFPSYRQRQLEKAWMARSYAHDPDWCFKRVELDTDEAAAQLFGHVDATQTLQPWFSPEMFSKSG